MSDQETPQPPASDESAQQKNNRTPERSGREDRERRGRRRQNASPQSRNSEQSLNMDELRELVELINEYGFTDFELENKDVRVRLRRELAPQIVSAPSAPPAASTHADTSTGQTHATSGATSSAVTPSAGSQAEAASNAAAPAEEEDLHLITSPIVGTFYRSPSPQAESFVGLGSQVVQDTVVCIIEAMKLMNEIQAETSGVVAKIYVENGQPVEYGQPLFGIKK
jgi:acetyl-CoA carboxylase biotin carboxyl carrier protein